MDDLGSELDSRLRRLSWLLHRQERSRGYAQANPAADPSRGQGRILAMLKLRDGMSTKDLSFLLGIRSSSLNETLGKLERAGLTRREPSPADRRVMLVRLTDQGRQSKQEQAEPLGIYSCLTAEEQTTFCAYLDRLIAALEQELGPQAQGYDRMMEARERWGRQNGSSPSQPTDQRSQYDRTGERTDPRSRSADPRTDRRDPRANGSSQDPGRTRGRPDPRNRPGDRRTQRDR